MNTCEHCWHEITHSVPFGGYMYFHDFCCKCRDIRSVKGNREYWDQFNYKLERIKSK